MKESKFEISKFTPSGGKNIGIRKSELITNTQFLFPLSIGHTNKTSMGSCALN